MTGALQKCAIACLIGGIGIAQAGPFDPLDPKVYVRPEDQKRARLARKPCTAADIENGCYRYGGMNVREAPCTYHADGALASIPLDQCYKMEKPRRFTGVWIDAFEGQAFLPEGVTMPEWPRGRPGSPGWGEQAEKARLAAIWLDVERAKVGHDWTKGSRKMRIDFIGRKTRYAGSYGHMGMSGNEIIVDRVLSLTKIE